MKQLFWLGVGVAVGVVVVRQISRRTRIFTPQGLGKEAASWADSLRDFGESIREGMREREGELRVALGVDEGELDRDTARSLLESPTAERGER